MSWNLFREALESDICDIQGGTTHEGIHLGAMAGTVDIVQQGLQRIRDPAERYYGSIPPCRKDLNQSGSISSTVGFGSM
jgi:trehalose/maltose hydrolase-like predicted phosphorylase